MTITPNFLFRSAAVAAVAAGLLFIGIQLGHPHSDVTAVTTTEWAVRNSAKVVMGALALVGITGMYLRQVKQVGRLGLLGYLVFAAGYLCIIGVTFVSAFVLPSIAETDPGYVNDVLAAATNGAAVGDIGLMQSVLNIMGLTYLGGGILFGIALFRARVLARWAAVLLALASLFTASLAILPDAFFRLLAFPNSIALIGLGVSLWLSTRVEPEVSPVAVGAEPLAATSVR
ncbi:hypothetical protein IPV09_01970 [Tessaracoccus sp. SD287]|uniref:hypothetical protein n=1 Tax=Tessaracoccus sp. SD287 TaxID=2782008 RepID=UPI001A95FC45|nr:hypothetical protein [Tessaracoccus sp. SD287]MBO1030099.1 hypothetical protein [Tessaracoccus sp. SD287]